MDVGPHRDLVGDLATALRKQGLKFGAYHSLFEFFNPLFLQDKSNNFTTQDFVRTKTLPELYELVNLYKPDLIWSDGDWMAEDTYWNSTNFLAWLYNDSPVKDVVVTNDRWGSNTMCKHGGYLTCKDQYNPKVKQARYFEDSTTLDRYGWEFRRNIQLSDIHTMEEVTALIAEVVSCGGNLLLNVGPTKDGIIIPIFEERLRQMGQWLAVNGEGIYGTKPWTFQNETLNGNIWYTSKPAASTEGVASGLTDVFAILLKWPEDLSQPLILADPVPTDSTQVSLLGYEGPAFPWIHHVGSGLEISLPMIPATSMPCEWAWVLKLTDIYN
ncbi:alpha-l-fucosidase-like [Plakobranchus ocellatus]|uniref:alpha-L-fucosidase n=1 Tax=Plakobranchus ocellatus TaxID=259542 RepID=A0AAV4BQ09_9GAST|nr:alpha-l-fucosidase-like [Plakobranchus ocellatus]